MDDNPKTDAQSCAPAPMPGPSEHEAPDVEALESAIPPEELARLTDDMIAAIKTVYDPEIPVDIYELGLIYKIDVDDDR